jgi:hypothetical protein
MKKTEGAPVTLVWPGGSPAGTGIFHDTGEMPNTNKKFFDRYNGGKELYLPNSAAGGSPGVRAHLVGTGRGEGHVETGLSPCLMRAAKDPSNPWGITADDVSERKVTPDGARAIDLNLYDFMALYGADGVKEAMERYGSGSDTGKPTPKPTPTGSDVDTLRIALEGAQGENRSLQAKLAEAIATRDQAIRERGDTVRLLEEANLKLAAAKPGQDVKGILDSVSAVATKIRKGQNRPPVAAPPLKGGGKYADALRHYAGALEALVATHREKAGL